MLPADEIENLARRGFIPLREALELVICSVGEHTAEDWLFDRLASGLLVAHAVLPRGTRDRAVIPQGPQAHMPRGVKEVPVANWSTEHAKKILATGALSLVDEIGVRVEAAVLIVPAQLDRLLVPGKPTLPPLAPAGYLNMEDALSGLVVHRYGSEWVKPFFDTGLVDSSSHPLKEVAAKFKHAVTEIAEAVASGVLNILMEDRKGLLRSVPKRQLSSPIVETWIRLGCIKLGPRSSPLFAFECEFNAWLQGAPAIEGASTPKTETAADVAGPIYATGLPGRPTSWYLVEPEIRRRHKAGKRWATMVECADEMIKWLGQAHPGAPRVQRKSLTNKLGELIRELNKDDPPPT